ncbi:MAG: UvrD-helicase domain-containing protein [Pseudomonadota bacterium]
MTDDRNIPDLAQRSRALDAAQSFIVQAPAGSGKTELLIQRYLRLLACVDHPEEIVAVTFTRKAAGEMRERVLQAMNAARAGDAPESAHEKLTLELAGAALARDAAADWHIADNPARLRIQTIDSLCASLTRQMPMLSRFGSQPESMEDADELYLEAARATVGAIENDDAIAQDMERLLTHLDNDVARIEELLADMLRRRDHWLRLVSGRERAELEAALGNARRAALQQVCMLFPASARDETLELARYAAANLAAVEGDSYIIDLKDILEFPGYAEADAKRWQGLAELLLIKDGAWRKSLDKRQGFPTGTSKVEKENARQWKQRMAQLLDDFSANDSLRFALDDLRRLPPPAYADSQWEVLGAIMRLLPRAVAQLKLAFQSRGQVDFVEVAQGALRALGDADAPTDLALALDYRIRHLLIDEFQDTSISQYELVARLTAGWEVGDGRSVFAVGDPMQSIYRFREAEVGLFLRARAAGIGSIELQPIALSANFRSQAGIVDWVNATFAQVMPAREDVAAGAVPYTASAATRAALAGPAVSVHAFFDNDHAAEAQQVADIVAQAHGDDAPGTVAILVRNRSHLREIVPRLKAAGLRFRAIEIEELGHRPVVQDLLALTRALSHPADRLAWLALLRAPWCGLTLADLHVLAGADHVRSVWELMHDDARTSALSADGCARLVRTRAALQASLAQRCRGELRARVAGAWYALGGPACVEDVTDLEDAEIYFDYLESHEQAAEIADLEAFEQGLAKLYALPDLEADERLQIMTIHKAKGLEFDTVIVPGLGRAPHSDDKRLFLWMEQPRSAFPPRSEAQKQAASLSLDGRGTEGEGETELLLAPIQETGTDNDPIYNWLQKLDAGKEGHEQGRLLYVAATRARQRLHLLGSVRLARDADGQIELKPPQKALLGKLWPVVESVYAQAAQHAQQSAPPAPQEDAATIDQNLQRLPAAWALPASPPPAAWTPPPDMARAQEEIEFSWAGETARHVGSVVHRWLQRIAEDGLNGWDKTRVGGLNKIFREQLVLRGVPADELAAATARVAQALAQTLADERGRWLLGAQHDARNEYRITAMHDGRPLNLVIDRLFRDADGRQWIVDYKTSSHEGGDIAAFLDREQERYAAQLARYADAVGNAQGTMLGLYFPLLAGWREWQAR